MSLLKSTQLLFLILVFSSCENKPIKKEEFMGFELGSSYDEYIQKLNQLVDNGVFQSINEVPYLTNNIFPEKIYYSIPYVYYLRGKNLTINKFKLFFCTREGDIVLTRKDNANQDVYLNITNNTSEFSNKTIPSSNEIIEKLISDLSKKYGYFDNSDTLEFSDSKKIEYLWKDKNGVNIKIEQTSGLFGLFASRSSITMEYSLTDELNDELKNNSNTY